MDMRERMAEVGRLQRDLRRARDRYEFALAKLENSNGGGSLENETAVAVLRRVLMAEAAEAAESVSLRAATFGELRSLGLSVTQARRVIAFRTRGRLRGVGDLHAVPGIPDATRDQLKSRLRD